MGLSKLERLFLSNQFKVLEKLYPEDAEYYATHRKAVEQGYSLQYPQLYEHLWEELPEERCRFVLDTLDMYRALTFGNQTLPPEQQLPTEKLRFPGFDGNNESELLGYAHYFTADLDRFHELTETNRVPILNSHMPTVGMYERMLSVWHESSDRYHLTFADIERVLGASRL